MKTIIALTGANGAVGSEALASLSRLSGDLEIRILLRNLKTMKPFVKDLIRTYPGRIVVIPGTTDHPADCVKLVNGANYVIHCSGMIPPKSEHDAEGAYRANAVGTMNMLAAASKEDQERLHFIYIGTVAEYGNRTEAHLWGRVGDPLISSDYDEYSHSKIIAERAVLEQGLAHFVSLRETAVAHKYIFANNLSDGLLYQACLNAPYEWVTDRDTGRLLAHLVAFDRDGTLPPDFWNRIYNIGGGKPNRLTGYETLARGFSLMGRSVKSLTQPNWFSARNFHGVFFYDSDVLEEALHFRSETIDAFWKRMKKKYSYYALGALVPPVILKKTLFTRLTRYDDAPRYWVEHHDEGRIKAFYKSLADYEAIPARWDNYPLLCENKAQDGTAIDYEALKDEAWAASHGQLLAHGFDESKPLSSLDLSDMQEAAAFRGGTCLSREMTPGDLYTKLTWSCHEGHIFTATPYTILFGGFWCPECFAKPWRTGRLARVSPFHGQVYFADHDESEADDVYPPDGK